MRYIKVFEEYSKPYEPFSDYDYVEVELVNFTDMKISEIKNISDELHYEIKGSKNISINNKFGNLILSINIDEDDWLYVFIVEDNDEFGYRCDDVYGLKELLKDKGIIK